MTDHHTCFSSEIPFSLFNIDSKQGSLHDLTDESKTFLWHQFMLDVLIHVPRSPTDIDNVITACRLVNEYDSVDPILLNENDVKRFQMEYKSDTAINCYTHDSFLYRAFNKACRMLDSDAIVLFHPIVKDLHTQLKQDCHEQLANGTLTLPLTVYRAQEKMGAGELKKIQEHKTGDLISMHTFLSTTSNCGVAFDYISGADPNTAVLFEITVNKTEQGDKRMNIFADISQKSKFKDEQEILFGVSSVFRIISVEQEDYHLFVKLELTHCEEDPSVQRFISEVQSYLYQNTGKQLPLIVFKQLFTIDSLSYVRPFVELMRFFLVETIQLFLIQMYNKNGRMKKLIDNVPDLHKLIVMTNKDMICPNNRIICLLFDLLHDFFYPFKDNRNHEDEVQVLDNNDDTSLLRFGGFLLLTGDLLKGIRYFQMLLKNESIDNNLKFFIHGLLTASYSVTKEKELALKSIQMITDVFQSSTAQCIPGWVPSLIAASCMNINDSDQRIDDTVKMLEPLINQEQSDNMVNEKLRLLHLSYICFQQDNFVDALNHLEEAVDIQSHMPSSAERIYNGAIYIQMAAAYFRLNNKSSALYTMEKGIKCFESYYPLTHQMFASLHFLYGYYLMQNDKPSEAIVYLKKALENSHFSTNQDFCALITTLLVSVFIQLGDLDSAEFYCHQALKYPSTIVSAQIPALLEVIPDLKIFVQYTGRDLIRQLVGAGLQFGQQLISQSNPHSSPIPGLNDETTWTTEKFIVIADHYRHRQDHEHAEIYYRKALDQMIETESKSMWNVYRKLVRMGDNNNQLRDYFIEQYSKYDDNNPNHFLMIATLQIILFKSSLLQNEYEIAFDCLINSALMIIKSLFHQKNTDSQCISDLLDHFFHRESVAQVCDILIELMKIHSTTWTTYLQQFLVKHTIFNEVAAIIHHATIDITLEQMNSKYQNNPLTKRIFQFLDILLQFLRQSITSIEISTLPLVDQLLKFLRNYNDEKSSWFYFIKALESLCINDNHNFLINIDRFRFETVSLKRYQELKEKISLIFAKLDENQFYSYLESIIKTS